METFFHVTDLFGDVVIRIDDVSQEAPTIRRRVTMPPSSARALAKALDKAAKAAEKNTE